MAPADPGSMALSFPSIMKRTLLRDVGNGYSTALEPGERDLVLVLLWPSSIQHFKNCNAKRTYVLGYGILLHYTLLARILQFPIHAAPCPLLGPVLESSCACLPEGGRGYAGVCLPGPKG